jgi:hypothetical protein
VVYNNSVISAIWEEAEVEDLGLRLTWQKYETLFEKQTKKQERLGTWLKW